MSRPPVSNATPVRLGDPQVSALLALLHDHRDRELQAELRRQLGALDGATLARLAQAARAAPDHVAMAVEAAREQRQWRELETELLALRVRRGGLEDLLLLLTRFAHADAAPATTRAQLDALAAHCRGRLEPLADASVLAVQLGQVLGGELRFAGNAADYYSPENSFLDAVLATRRGVPLSLSCLYLLVAWRLGLPLRGIGLPGHFIVGLPRRAGDWVYLDPFHHGRVVTEPDCARLVQQQGHRFEQRHLAPVDASYIFLRTLANLYQAYERLEDWRRADVVLHYGRLWG